MKKTTTKGTSLIHSIIKINLKRKKERELEGHFFKLKVFCSVLIDLLEASLIFLFLKRI